MDNLLLGNGINIEFTGNDEYKNWAILQRLNENMAVKGKYNDEFAGKATVEHYYDFFENLNSWFKNKALRGVGGLKLVTNQDELNALLEMSNRYSDKNPGVLEIGLEDYLLGLKMFNESYGNDAVTYEAIFQAVKFLMLDAIYNNGDIEQIYNNMDCFKPDLLRYKNIFTLNYDSNVDELIGRPIYHLHGTFKVLHHEYRPETFKGWAILQCGKTLPRYIVGKEHLYCDAVLGFSGENKLNTIRQYNDAYENPLTQDLLKKHPELECPVYPIKQFKEMTGELHMIGVCPYNDSHIFKMINENPNITQVVYYSACKEHTVQIKKIIKKRILIEDVFDYWAKIKKEK